MWIITRCPKCGSNWLFSSKVAGRKVRCNRCHRLFKVPLLEEMPEAIKQIRQAKSSIYVDEAGRIYG